MASQVESVPMSRVLRGSRLGGGASEVLALDRIGARLRDLLAGLIRARYGTRMDSGRSLSHHAGLAC